MRRLFTALLLATSCATFAGCAADTTDDAITSLSPLTDEGDRAAAALEKSRFTRDEQNAALARQMSQIGKALTADQQRKYTQAFEALPQVAQATKDFESHAAELDRELRSIMASPTKLASVLRSPLDDGGMFAASKALVDTRYATTALLFAAHVLGDDPAYRYAGVSDEKLIREIVEPALPMAFASLLIKEGARDAALRELKTLLTFAKGKCDQAISWIEKYRSFTGAYDTNADLVRIGNTPVGKGLRAVGALLALWEVADGVTELTRGNARDAIAKFVKGGPESVTALAQATSAFRRIVFGIEKTPFAATVVKVATKVAAAIGVVAGIIKTFDDLKRWDASDEAKLRVLSDVVSVGAAVLTLVGLASGGAVVGVVALGIALFADFLEDQRLARMDAEQKLACLGSVFQNEPSLGNTLAKADPTEIKTLAGDFGMSALAIQRTARAYPDGLIHDQFKPMPMHWVGLAVMKDMFALDGNDLATVIEKVANGEPDLQRRNYKVHFFATYLSLGGGWDPLMLDGKNGALDWLRGQEGSESFQLSGWAMDVQEWRRIVGDVCAYLQTQL